MTENEMQFEIERLNAIHLDLMNKHNALCIENDRLQKRLAALQQSIAKAIGRDFQTMVADAGEALRQ